MNGWRLNIITLHIKLPLISVHEHLSLKMDVYHSGNFCHQAKIQERIWKRWYTRCYWCTINNRFIPSSTLWTWITSFFFFTLIRFGNLNAHYKLGILPYLLWLSLQLRVAHKTKVVFFQLIVDGEGKFDYDILSIGTNFRVEYDSLVDLYNSKKIFCGINKENVIITSKDVVTLKPNLTLLSL